MMMINVFRSVVVSLAFLYNFWVIIYRTAFDEITSSTVIIWWSSSAIFDCHWQLLWSDSAFPLKVSSRLSERLNICDGHPHSFPDRYVESTLFMLLIVQVKYVMLKSILTKISWFGQRNRIREDKYQFLRDSVSSTFSISIDLLSAYLEDGVLQTDSVKLRQHYMNSTTFYIDLLCLLPLDFLYLSLEFQSMLRVCRLVKIYRFWEFLDRCSFYLLVAIFSP